jgi:hypothetical protein
LSLHRSRAVKNQNQHRHGAASPAPFKEHGSTVLFGQAQIQDDGIVRFGVALKPSFFTIEGAVEGIARPRKRGGDLAVEVLSSSTTSNRTLDTLLQKQCFA